VLASRVPRNVGNIAEPSSPARLPRNQRQHQVQFRICCGAIQSFRNRAAREIKDVNLSEWLDRLGYPAGGAGSFPWRLRELRRIAPGRLRRAISSEVCRVALGSAERIGLHPPNICFRALHKSMPNALQCLVIDRNDQLKAERGEERAERVASDTLDRQATLNFRNPGFERINKFSVIPHDNPAT